MPRYPSRSTPPSSFSFGPGPLSTTLKALIGVNVIVFIATEYLYEPLKIRLGFVPPLAIGGLQLWRFATYMFVHGDIFHILFNMLALWMFGAELEQIWGTRFFVKFYFIVGAGAALMTALVSYIPYPPLQALAFSNVVGASGAIYGLILAYALYFPERRIYLIIFPVPVRIYVVIAGVLAFYASVSANGGGVASATHLGGLLVAWVYLTTLRKGPRMRLNPWAEVKYRWVKWRLASARKKFDVYTGGRGNGRIH